jgi:TonB family protein
VANAIASGLFNAEELRAFGEPGAFLAGHPARQPGEAPPGMSLEAPGPEVQREVLTRGDLPRLSPGDWERRQWLRLEVLVDEQGRLRDPVVLSASSVEAAYRALEAMRDWRFEPARKHGQPVATLHSLAVNPPGHLALDKIIAASAETKAIEVAARRQQWRQAGELADRRWHGLLATTDLYGRHEAERAALGMTLALRALARVDQDPEEQVWARCRWEAAQSLLPSLYDLDLAPYGAAGEALTGWRMEAFTAPFKKDTARPAIAPTRAEVRRPEKIKAPPPSYPFAARKQRLIGRVIIEAIIDTEGRLRHPAVIDPADASDLVVFAASALDTVCDWRFRPATLDGRPVKVYYTLTVTYDIGRGR